MASVYISTLLKQFQGRNFETFKEWLRNKNKYSDYNGALENAKSEVFRSSRSSEKFKEGMSRQQKKSYN